LSFTFSTFYTILIHLYSLNSAIILLKLEIETPKDDWKLKSKFTAGILK